MHVVKEFFWALLEKLLPARVLLSAALIMMVLPSTGFSYHDSSHQFQVLEIDFHFWGGVLLFLLLMLEIDDRVVMKRDLQIAREIQTWMLPSAPPQIAGLSIAYATPPQHRRRRLLRRVSSSGQNQRRKSSSVRLHPTA